MRTPTRPPRARSTSWSTRPRSRPRTPAPTRSTRRPTAGSSASSSSPSASPKGGDRSSPPTRPRLFFANGPAHGIWSDNVLVLARPHRDLDLKGLERTLPEELREAEPGCEVLSCRVIPQGKGEALETVVRTRRGPFSMTVLERRFRGGGTITR